ncbi:MAG TPA: metal-dependent hydrolase [Longimicrobiales bacterium]|nr:metal-dependent hydrolase [Longimicrobiales bacterium]
MPRVTWHGHATFSLTTESGHRLIIDPFLDDNPASDLRTSDVDRLDYILVSHGHEDHFADAIPLAKKTGATIIATFEIVGFCQEQGVENVHALHIGGGHSFPFGYAKMTPALHGGQVAGDQSGHFSTAAGGWWLDLDGKRLYHAGDTALLMEMQLLRGKVDLALLPIGDNYTMGPEDAARAVEFIAPKVVIPMHYNTWPIIAQDPRDFKRRVGGTSQVVVLHPGGTYDF